MKILLADDHAILRESLRELLEERGLQVVGEASNGREAVSQVAKLNPDVAVMDIGMPLLNGIEAAREIGRVAPQTLSILLTMFEDDDYILSALHAGVRGYVLKAQASADLVKAIHSVMRGSVYLSPGISQTVIDAYVHKQALPSEPLTDRERQVLHLIAEGKSTKEVANLLKLSVKTAETHRTKIMRKLDIHNTAGLVRYAVRRHLISL
ncbi:MAG: response regulator transcription factor [Rhodospirillaceae bacterium]|nr:MAG: response regulator transcription factor [Rhodospirillaceae bacterium]